MAHPVDWLVLLEGSPLKASDTCVQASCIIAYQQQYSIANAQSKRKFPAEIPADSREFSR
jgi:hypothetical protein